jgi:hypothetical protein
LLSLIFAVLIIISASAVLPALGHWNIFLYFFFRLIELDRDQLGSRLGVLTLYLSKG